MLERFGVKENGDENNGFLEGGLFVDRCEKQG